MDISSLLSPQDSPAGETPPSVHSGRSSPAKRPSRQSKRSPLGLNKSVTTARHTEGHKDEAHRPLNAVIQPQWNRQAGGNASSAEDSRPAAFDRHDDGSRPLHTAVYRTASTPGMDALADLASMQRHHLTPPLHSPPVFAAQRQASSGSRIHTLSGTTSLHSPRDVTMAEAQPRDFTAPSLSQADSKEIAELAQYLEQNSFAYESHARLINLLHNGFLAHVEAKEPPHAFPLLDELRQARQAMDYRFSLGEDLLSDWIKDDMVLANTLEERIAVMELCHKAIEDEPQSAILWRLYGGWMYTLWSAAFESDQTSSPQSWSAEDKEVGRGLFGWEVMMQVWEQGIAATQWRLNDGNLVWDRAVQIMIDDQARAPSADKVKTLKGLFMDRLLKPHSTWEETFQMFSTFMSKYDNASYEETMVTMNQKAAHAKRQYALRESFELRLKNAVRAGDRDAEWFTFTEYLDWEVRMKGVFSLHLINALYERAALRFPTDVDLWEDYVNLLIESRSSSSPVLTVSKRAARHCPWSGNLWAKYLLCLEVEGKDFSEMEEVKHRATKTGLLDVGGLEELLKVYVAWCGFLRRRAFSRDADEDQLDIAEVGIRSALEHVREIGEKRYGADFKGDPMYRLERIYIKFNAQSGNIAAAREKFRSLIWQHGDSFDFWYRYYIFEMVLDKAELVAGHVPARPRPALLATEVLRQALERISTVDWPEKLVEIFRNHCELHETAQELRVAETEARKATKLIMKRRQKEASEAAAASRAAAQEQQQAGAPVDEHAGGADGTGKRKRDLEMLETDVTASKRTKQETVDREQSASVASPTTSQFKRDRENSTLVVKNLPEEATEAKVRQFFRDCGTINSIKLIPAHGDHSQTAIVEFDTQEDAHFAKTRETKPFGENTIEISIGTQTTLWVTNFPPTADEKYIRDLFRAYGEIVDVRFPSLQYNTHRRFCYVQFLSADQANAATELDGKIVEGNRRLTAKISDPSRRQDRTGASYEGREICVGNLNWSASDDEIRELFAQFGSIESLRVPRNLGGKTKGVAFLDFSTKEEAEAAVQSMNLKTFKDRILKVSISVPKKAKLHATTVVQSATPEPGGDENHVPNGTASDSKEPTGANPPSSAATKRERTIALLNIPDTVNDARIQALVEPHGRIKKIILRPDHQGAIVEFEHVQDVGKASLSLDGHEIVPGRHIRVGTVDEMLKQKADHKIDKLGDLAAAAKKKAKEEAAAASMAEAAEAETNVGTTASSSAPLAAPRHINRPAQPGSRRGGRGGLGLKRAGVGLGGGRALDHRMADADEQDTAGQAEGSGKKSNADFKALFLKGKETKEGDS